MGLSIDGRDEKLKDEKPKKIVTTNKGKHWTKEEDDKLLDEMKQRININIIATSHGRSVGSIKSRHNKITLNYCHDY